MHRRRVHVALPPDAYRRLAQIAEREERIVDQQATYLLKRAIEAEQQPDALRSTDCTQVCP